MARAPKFPVTSAIRALRAAKAEFTPHLYDYVERGGTSSSSAALGVDEHAVIKTIVLADAQKQPLIMLMHGDRSVATGVLAKRIGKNKIQPCAPDVAQRLSGYQVGGTSPFGLKREMPIYAQESIRALPSLYINGGKRGFLVQMSGAELERVLSPTWIDAQA